MRSLGILPGPGWILAPDLGGSAQGGCVWKSDQSSLHHAHTAVERRDEGMDWVSWRVRERKQGQQKTKREIQLKYGINQSNHSQQKLWNFIGLNESSGHTGSSLVTTLTSFSFTFVRVVTNGSRWLCSGDGGFFSHLQWLSKVFIPIELFHIWHIKTTSLFHWNFIWKTNTKWCTIVK